MELLELLKTMSDQSSRADIQAQIDTLRDAIVMVDHKITGTWWILFAMICATLILVGYVAARLDKRLKRIEWDLERHDQKLWPGYREDEAKRQSRIKFEKEVLLNDRSCMEGSAKKQP